MDKFEKKANELSEQLDNCIDSFIKLPETTFGPEYELSEEWKPRFPDLLLDIRILFYEFDPSMPLTSELEKFAAKFAAKQECGGSIEKFEIVALSRLLGKFLDMLKFRQEPS